jgi:hypothetical protein
VHTAGDYLPDAAKVALSSVDIFGVDSNYANAIPQVAGGRRRIFVFEGLQRLVLFYADLVKVLDALQELRPNARAAFDTEMLPEALAFSMAGFSTLSNAMSEQRMPATIHDMLGPIARRDVLSAYRLAMTFVLLHELGHIELGHLGLDGVRSERGHLDLAQPEPLSDFQLDELGADAFAFGLLPHRLRGEFMPSLMFLLGGHAFLEAFSGSLSAHHPLAVNRLGALADLAPMEEADKAIVRAWIGDQVESWRNFGRQRSEFGADLRARIEERMPVANAYRVLADIKARVAAEIGLLEIPRRP